MRAVTAARWNRTCLTHFLKHPPAPAVSQDIQMPVLDGIQSVRRIRQHESDTGCARTFISAITAFGSAEQRADCMRAGAGTELVFSPATAEELALRRHPRLAGC